MNNTEEIKFEKLSKKLSLKHKVSIMDNLKQFQIKDIESVVEDEDIKKIREEMFRELQRKEEESKIKKTVVKEKESKKGDNYNKPKEFDGRKITSDVHGSILHIKNVVVEKLQKDFGFPK